MGAWLASCSNHLVDLEFSRQGVQGPGNWTRAAIKVPVHTYIHTSARMATESEWLAQGARAAGEAYYGAPHTYKNASIRATKPDFSKGPRVRWDTEQFGCPQCSCTVIISYAHIPPGLEPREQSKKATRVLTRISRSRRTRVTRPPVPEKTYSLHRHIIMYALMVRPARINQPAVMEADRPSGRIPTGHRLRFAPQRIRAGQAAEQPTGR